MTHTIHRFVTPPENDWVLNIRCSKDINRAGSGDKFREIIHRLEPLGMLSFGNPGDGSTLRVSVKEILEKLHDGSNLHIVFGEKSRLLEALRILKEMDTGLSVALSGPTDQIDDIARTSGLKIDSVHFGAGILHHPCFNPDIESVVSLCGHMRVSPHLVNHLSDKIKDGRISPAEAAKKIGRVCKCGCFNTTAAADRLAHLAEEKAAKIKE